MKRSPGYVIARSDIVAVKLLLSVVNISRGNYVSDALVNLEYGFTNTLMR